MASPQNRHQCKNAKDLIDEMERTADVTRSEEHSALEAELCKQVVFTWICHVKSFHTANKNIYTPGLNHTVNGANNW